MRLAALRRALLPTVAAALVSVAPAAGAQTVTMLYAPSCGPGTPCSLLRFNVGNDGGSTLMFNALTLTASSAPFAFAPTAGGVALYQAVDAVGPFGGSGTVTPGGSQLFIDFLGGNGFAFELSPGASGYVEVALAQPTALSDGAFTFAATGPGGTFTRSVNILPEPSTISLMGGGLALLGLAARRRRRVQAAA